MVVCQFQAKLTNNLINLLGATLFLTPKLRIYLDGLVDCISSFKKLFNILGM